MTLSLTYAGFNYVADIEGAYATADSLGTMVSASGANSVALTIDYGIDASRSTVYADRGEKGAPGITETLENLTATIRQAVAAKLTVTVRPLIDFSVNASREMLTSRDGTEYRPGDWRATYRPDDTRSFFESYRRIVVAQAEAAEAGGAQIFDVGSELDQLTGAEYREEWSAIITGVRAVFSGQLVYSAIWNDGLSPWQDGGGRPDAGTGDITTQISFWDQLDYVGIDQYAPISDSPDPGLADLVEGWTREPTVRATQQATGGKSLIQYYEDIAAALKKPLLFTELGYNSAPDAAANPAATSSAVYDPALQARLYQAFFQAWDEQGSAALAGVYLWNWQPDPSTVQAGKQPSWTPQGNDEALAIVQTAYSAATACYAAGTRIATPWGERAVEALRAGSLVTTAGGAVARVVWTGMRTVDLVRHPCPAREQPVRVSAGAFGTGQPLRPLFLSPDHAVSADGALIPVGLLLNGASIVQVTRQTVTYVHVELERHDLLLADGLACESYRDTGNRGAFPQSDQAPAGGAEPCAPLIERGPVLDAVRRRLAERAGPGLQQDIQARRPGTLRTIAGPSIVTIRLLSDIGRHDGDARRLGALITAIRVDGSALAMDDPRLGLGFHEPERHGNRLVRWTDGAAVVGVGPGQGARVVEIDVASVALEVLRAA